MDDKVISKFLGEKRNLALGSIIKSDVFGKRPFVTFEILYTQQHKFARVRGRQRYNTNTLLK